MVPRLLLLQARRSGDEERLLEREAFAKAAGLPLDRVAVHDVIASVPSLIAVRRFDALMMGGAGEFDVSKAELPTHDRLLDLFSEVAATGHPTFASCFGFQYLAQALGGEVAFDPESTEIGTYELELTEEGREDPVFGVLPDRFLAQLGRKERAIRLPPGARNLATSEACPHQAMRVDSLPVWATQFHPELEMADNRRRYVRYAEIYSGYMSGADRRRALDRFGDSPETGRLLPRFLEVALGFRGSDDGGTGERGVAFQQRSPAGAPI